MGGLSETTLEKMKIEKERENYYLYKINDIVRGIDSTEIIKLYEHIRVYKERIFKLKYQAEDINKLYNKLLIPDYLEVVSTSRARNGDMTEEEISKMRQNDFRRISYSISNYYENMIGNLELVLLEEKAEKDSEQKEVDADKEDVFELE